ncbi:MAG: hypothetical protein ACE5JA_06735, partial [bacterium]
MTQLFLTALNNRDLFSNHILENILFVLPEWPPSDHDPALKDIRQLRRRDNAFLRPKEEEPMIDERFFASLSGSSALLLVK